MARKWWTLVAVSAATFMLLLDITVVNTALPAIRRDLGASFADLQWVVDAYALTLAAFVLSAGSLADRFGRRRIFAGGLTIFTIASLLAGLAAEATLLNLARALQGVGAAAMFALSLALLAQEFAPKERAPALAIYGATIGVAVAIGPLVGGAIVQGLGWRWVFFINVPVGIAAIALTYLKLRESRNPSATRVDRAGVLTFSAALFSLVLALVRGNTDGWSSPLIISLFAAAAALLIAFVVIEQRAREPMLPLHLFARPAFTGVQLAAFAVSASLFALFLYLTLYLQNYLHYSPLAAGLRYLPLTLAPFVIAPLAATLMGRAQARVLIAIGLGMAGAGMIWMSGITATDHWTGLLGGFVLAGAGVGLLNPVIADVALKVVPREQSGMAAGINDTFRQVGVAVGVALWGAIFLARGAAKVADLTAGSSFATGGHPRELVQAASSGNLHQALLAVPAHARASLAHVARASFLAGLNEILLIGGGLALAGALFALWLVRKQDIDEQAAASLEVAPEPSAA